MKFRLRKYLNLYINGSSEQINLIQVKVISAIRDLEKLYALESLSDEELKAIVQEYYKLYAFDGLFWDEESICKSILKKNNIDYAVVETNIITMVTEESQELSYLNVVVYYDKDSDFDINRVYSYEELEELIKDRKIVVTEFSCSDKEVTKEAAKNADLTQEDKLPTLDKIDEKNFWGYDDIIIPRIKKRLQKSRVHKDIMSIINSMRLRLDHEQSKMMSLKDELYGRIASITSLETLQNSYKNYLEELALSCDKKLNR